MRSGNTRGTKAVQVYVESKIAASHIRSNAIFDVLASIKT